MQNKKSSRNETIIACILTFLIILVVVAAVRVSIKYSSVKNTNKGERVTSQSEKLEEEEYKSEENYTEIELDSFSVGSDPTIPKSREESEKESVEEENGDFVIADSNSRYLTELDLVGLTKEELSYARNEIYARHGRMFDSIELQDYFRSKEWYLPLYSADSFPEEVLNEFEKENANFISKYEKENF